MLKHLSTNETLDADNAYLTFEPGRGGAGDISTPQEFIFQQLAYFLES